MPRVHGVSSTSVVWCIRRSPKPRTQALWFFSRPLVLFTNVTLIDFLSAMVLTQDVFDCQTALSGDSFWICHFCEAFYSGPDNIDRIR